jgi:hypothetical protein
MAMTKKAREKARKRMRAMVAYLKVYIGTYDKQIGYEDYRDETLIDDVLYGLGVALDGKEHQFANGFDRFRAKLRKHLDESRR